MNKKIIFGIAIIFLIIIAIVKINIDSRNKNSLNESASARPIRYRFFFSTQQGVVLPV